MLVGHAFWIEVPFMTGWRVIIYSVRVTDVLPACKKCELGMMGNRLKTRWERGETFRRNERGKESEQATILTVVLIVLTVL